MFDLEQVIRERRSTRLFFAPAGAAAFMDAAVALAAGARRTRTSSRGTWCSRRGRRDRLQGAARGGPHRPPNIPPCPNRSGTIAASWASGFTGR